MSSQVIKAEHNELFERLKKLMDNLDRATENLEELKTAFGSLS